MVSRRQAKSVAEVSSDSDDLPDHPFALSPAPSAPAYYDGIPLRKALPKNSAPIPASRKDARRPVTTAPLKHSFQDEIAGSSLSAAIDLTFDSPVSDNILISWSALNIAVKVTCKPNQQRRSRQRRGTAGFGKIFLLLNALHLR